MLKDFSSLRDWENGIPQIGEFDEGLAARSKEQLRAFVREFPEIEVYLGHQP